MNTILQNMDTRRRRGSPGAVWLLGLTALLWCRPSVALAQVGWAQPGGTGDIYTTSSSNLVIGTGGPGAGARVHIKNNGSFALRLENVGAGGAMFNFIVDNPASAMQLATGSGNTPIMTARTDATVTFARSTTFSAGITVDTNSIFVDPGTHRVGIGTTTPGQKLEVAGGIRIASGATIDAGGGDLNFNAPGNMVFGAGVPSGARVHYMNGGSFAVRYQNVAAGGSLWSFVVDNPNSSVPTWQLTGGMGNTNLITATLNGNIGLGTTAPDPNFRLDVSGPAKIQGNVIVGGNGTFGGNMIVNGSIGAKYQDLAEWVPTSRPMQAGTVVVLDRQRSNEVIPSFRAYDTSVAGVISATPGLLLGEEGEGKVKVATTGRVKVKVDASQGAIQVGDLLVCSDKEGRAMRSEPVNIVGIQMHRPGTLIGKALEPLAEGEGEILVLLSLQ